MKAFVLITLSVIAFSIACSASKSAGSPSASNTASPVSQIPSPAPNSTESQKSPCTISLAGSPDIKGLRLGMTPDQVLAVFPGSKDDADIKRYLSQSPNRYGVSQLTVHPEKYGSRDAFKEVREISFLLLDGRVYSFTVGHNGPEFSHVDKFVAKFIEGKNLPPVDQWADYVGQETQMKSLKCAEFEINVYIGGEQGRLNYVLMKDLSAEKELQDRRAKARAQATPTPVQ